MGVQLTSATLEKNAMLVELHVEDFDRVRDYYEHLGFTVVWERPPERFKGYLVMSNGSNTICFWGGNKDIYEHQYFGRFPSDTKKGYGVELVIMVEDLDEIYRKAQQHATIVEDMELRPWGLYDFRVEDPFGYYLRFTSIHDIHDPKFAVK
jgi:lactoylglutathione lyase